MRLLVFAAVISVSALAGPSKVTGVSLEAAKKSVKSFTPYAEAMKSLTASLGEPTKDHSWAVVEKSTCFELRVEDGGANGALVSFVSVDKMMKSMFDACAAKSK